MVDVGAIINAGANMNIGAWNYLNERRAQDLNVQLQNEANEQNERLFHEQLQWNEDMYNKYSSPAALRKQYEAAGLNPNLMMQGAHAGNVSTATTTPNMQAAHVDAAHFNADLSSLQGITLRGAEQENIQAATQAQLLDNRYKLFEKRLNWQEQLSRIDKNSTEAKHIRRMIKQADVELKYMDDYLNARNDAQKEQANLNRNLAKTEYYKSEYQQMVNDAFPQLNQAQLALFSAQSFAAYKSGIASQASANLSDEMRRHEAIKAIGTAIENGIKQNQFKLSDFNLSEAELRDMRTKGTLSKKNSKLFNEVDNFLDWLTSIPAGLLRAIK